MLVGLAAGMFQRPDQFGSRYGGNILVDGGVWLAFGEFHPLRAIVQERLDFHRIPVCVAWDPVVFLRAVPSEL